MLANLFATKASTVARTEQIEQGKTGVQPGARELRQLCRSPALGGGADSAQVWEGPPNAHWQAGRQLCIPGGLTI